jgi:hypothetical protein
MPLRIAGVLLVGATWSWLLQGGVDLLEAYTLADLSGMTQGRLPWPGETL